MTVTFVGWLSHSLRLHRSDAHRVETATNSSPMAVGMSCFRPPWPPSSVAKGEAMEMAAEDNSRRQACGWGCPSAEAGFGCLSASKSNCCSPRRRRSLCSKPMLWAVLRQAFPLTSMRSALPVNTIGQRFRSKPTNGSNRFAPHAEVGVHALESPCFCSRHPTSP